MIKLTLIFTSLLLLSVGSFSQTCTLILRTDSAIFVGSDTRRTTWGVNGVSKYDTVCKIKKLGDVYFSISGLNIERAYQIASRCVRLKCRFWTMLTHLSVLC